MKPANASPALKECQSTNARSRDAHAGIIAIARGSWTSATGAERSLVKMAKKPDPLLEIIEADGVKFSPSEWNLDNLGRYIAQSLANRSELTVRTYSILADLVHVRLPNGDEYTIDITHNEEPTDGTMEMRNA